MNQFKVTGMHCNACQKVIEKMVGRISGVSGVTVSLDGNLAVSADRAIGVAEIQQALTGTDYTVAAS